MSEQNGAETTCEKQLLTAVALRTLKNQSRLEEGCIYAITNYSRGCLSGGVVEEILLTATGVNQLSMDVSVKTSFDQVAWEGRYDADTYRITALYDNLGNRVSGRYGNEVDRFAWGQNNVTYNTIEDADVYMDCEPSITISYNTWTSRSYTDLRGASGTFFNENHLSGWARFYANGTTNLRFVRNHLATRVYVYFTGQDSITFDDNNIESGSYVRKYGGGLWRVYNSIFSRGDIRHYEGTFYVNGLTMLSSSRLYNREQGNLDVRYTTIGAYSMLDLRKVSGNHRIWYSSYGTYFLYYTRIGVTGGNITTYYSSFESGTFDYISGDATLNMYYQKQNSNGYVRLQSITDALNLYQNTLKSFGALRINGITGTANISYNVISGYPTSLTLTNVNGTKTIYRNNFNSGSTVSFVNYDGNLTLQYNNVASNGDILVNGCKNNMNIFSNNVNSLGRITIDGSSAAITLYGLTVTTRAELDLNNTTGSVTMYYTTISDYNAEIFLNGTNAAYIYGSQVNSGARAVFNGGRADVRYSLLHSSTIYTVTGGGATARLWYSTLHSLSRVNSTNAYIYASQVGSQSTLNALTFQFMRSRLHGLGTKTLTANNSNRYEERGTLGLI